MAKQQTVFTEPWDINRRVARLGLTVAILIAAVEKSLAAWAACTGNDPLNFPGIASWAAAIRSLGEDLALKGWARIEDVGQPLIVNADQSIALTVASGDENTGRVATFAPKTKSSKGPRTIEKVQHNAWLFPQMEADENAKLESTKKRNANTWMLLLHRDTLAGEIRCELSRPITLDTEGRIDGWSERIILKPVDFDRVLNAVPEDGGNSDDGEIDIDIKRRA